LLLQATLVGISVTAIVGIIAWIVQTRRQGSGPGLTLEEAAELTARPLKVTDWDTGKARDCTIYLELRTLDDAVRITYRRRELLSGGCEVRLSVNRLGKGASGNPLILVKMPGSLMINPDQQYGGPVGEDRAELANQVITNTEMAVDVRL